MITEKTAPFAREDLAHIVRNLRPRDAREIFALRWDNDADALITDTLAVAGAMWRMFCYEAEPVAMAGVIPVRPGVVVAGAYGTPLWPKVMLSITRFARHWSIPRLRQAGYHRAEAYALAVNIDSRNWLLSLGAQEEAHLHGYGREQEDFILYAWRLQDVLRRGRREQLSTESVSQ